MVRARVRIPKVTSTLSTSSPSLYLSCSKGSQPCLVSIHSFDDITQNQRISSVRYLVVSPFDIPEFFRGVFLIVRHICQNNVVIVFVKPQNTVSCSLNMRTMLRKSPNHGVKEQCFIFQTEKKSARKLKTRVFGQHLYNYENLVV